MHAISPEQRDGVFPLRHLTFSSRDYPLDDAPGVYQFLFASSALVVPLREPFRVEVSSTWSEHMRFHFLEGVPFVFHRPARKIEFDGIDGIVVQHVETGAMEGTFDGRPVKAGPGSLYVIDFARPAIIRDAPEILSQRRNFVAMPRAFAQSWLGPLERLHGFVIPPEVAQTYTEHLLRLRERLPGRAALDVATLTTTATLLARAITQAAGHGTSRSDPARLFQKACLHIDAALGNPNLGAAEIARAIGASRTRLFAAFQEAGGVERHVRTTRLERVRAALSEPAQAHPIAVLAARFGFRSAAQLSRLFRQHYGITPTQFSAEADPGGVRRHETPTGRAPSGGHPVRRGGYPSAEWQGQNGI